MVAINHSSAIFSCTIILCIGLWLAVSAGVMAEPVLKPEAVWGGDKAEILIATGSPGELGLVEALVSTYVANKPAGIGWIKAGSGESLQLLKNGIVDIVLVHAPAAEKQAVAEGWAQQRVLIGANQFYLVGPETDTADVSKSSSVIDAYQRIADKQAIFVSRGDNSGTHQRELQIWQAAGIVPAGDWYLKTNTFMLESLKLANSIGGYFMTDSSTWLAARPELTRLRLLFSDDPMLVNSYHALIGKNVTDTAAGFFRFLTSAAAQKIIAEFGNEKYGEPIYRSAVWAANYAD